MRAPVDQGGPLDVRREQGVDWVLLGELAVHANHGGLQNHVRVAQVGNGLVNADWSRP